MVRAALGLSGEWVADRLGASLRNVRRWEHGRSPVPDGIRAEMGALDSV